MTLMTNFQFFFTALAAMYAAMLLLTLLLLLASVVDAGLSRERIAWTVPDEMMANGKPHSVRFCWTRYVTLSLFISILLQPRALEYQTMDATPYAKYHGRDGVEGRVRARGRRLLQSRLYHSRRRPFRYRIPPATQQENIQAV